MHSFLVLLSIALDFDTTESFHERQYHENAGDPEYDGQTSFTLVNPTCYVPYFDLYSYFSTTASPQTTQQSITILFTFDSTASKQRTYDNVLDQSEDSFQICYPDSSCQWRSPHLMGEDFSTTFGVEQITSRLDIEFVSVSNFVDRGTWHWYLYCNDTMPAPKPTSEPDQSSPDTLAPTAAQVSQSQAPSLPTVSPTMPTAAPTSSSDDLDAHQAVSTSDPTSPTDTTDATDPTDQTDPTDPLEPNDANNVEVTTFTGNIDDSGKVTTNPESLYVIVAASCILVVCVSLFMIVFVRKRRRNDNANGSTSLPAASPTIAADQTDVSRSFNLNFGFSRGLKMTNRGTDGIAARPLPPAWTGPGAPGAGVEAKGMPGPRAPPDSQMKHVKPDKRESELSRIEGQTVDMQRNGTGQLIDPNHPQMLAIQESVDEPGASDASDVSKESDDVESLVDGMNDTVDGLDGMHGTGDRQRIMSAGSDMENIDELYGLDGPRGQTGDFIERQEEQEMHNEKDMDANEAEQDAENVNVDVSQVGSTAKGPDEGTETTNGSTAGSNKTPMGTNTRRRKSGEERVHIPWKR